MAEKDVDTYAGYKGWDMTWEGKEMKDDQVSWGPSGQHGWFSADNIPQTPPQLGATPMPEPESVASWPPFAEAQAALTILEE